jgi:hypothetical protein
VVEESSQEGRGQEDKAKRRKKRESLDDLVTAREGGRAALKSFTVKEGLGSGRLEAKDRLLDLSRGGQKVSLTLQTYEERYTKSKPISTGRRGVWRGM